MVEAPLLIRADASARMGTGHAMRCLSLAQAWQDAGGRTVFAMAEETSALRQRIEAEGCDIVSVEAEPGSTADASQLVALSRARNSSRVAVDGYQFGADYQRTLKSAGLKTLFFDDYGHARHYSADLVLNQNVSADEGWYADREPYTRLLLGPRYALLRREFSAWRDYVRQIPPTARKVLITLGGSDPEKLTALALDAAASVATENLAVAVIIGGSNPYFESLQRLGVELTNRHDVKITVQRDVANMPELMAWADVAISAAGTTCWELCLLALPALLIDVADNQTAVARELHRRQCAIHLGAAQSISGESLGRELEKLLRSQELRQNLSTRSRQLVDGKGAPRVVSALLGEDGVHLRPAQNADSRLLFEWANDPEVRAAAFSTGSILWEQHEQWFAGKMRDPDCRILIAENERGEPFGQLRVDWRSREIDDEDGDVDVSISREYRGGGWGSRMIRLGAAAMFAERGTRLHAFIKHENQASCRAFESAGFKRLGEEVESGHRAVHYVLSKVKASHKEYEGAS